jgi:3-phenylpropionate/trans-cinnamate dioxygenase ferredoxin subunit
MSQLVTVAQDHEIAEGAVKVVEAGGRRIALCKFNGSVYAIDDVCTHDRGPLDQGELIGEEIECPRHGARFDITTGRATRLPAIQPVRTYPVRVENGAIVVEVD